jgi:signal transduction histidine kinase
MPENDKPKIRCYVIIAFDKEFHPLKDAIRTACKEIGARLTLPEEIAARPVPIADRIYLEIARCDLIIADVSRPNPNIFYEIGLAHALGKPAIFLIQEGAGEVPLSLRDYPYLQYVMTFKGLAEFQHRFREVLEDFIQSPRRLRRPFLPFTTRFAHLPYIVDLEKLEPREFENLCFELIAQMGFRRVEWGKEFREIDVVATLPKKDPDGYEYQELWLISMGRRAPVEMMMEMAVMDPEHFLHRMLRRPEGLEELFSKYKIRHDVPITILLILRREGPQPEMFEHELGRMGRRLKERPYPITIRVRWWDPPHLTNLIQQYPQIAFKYFSEEARDKSKYRKTPEVLYGENVKLTENLIAVKNQLEEEKKKRFIAERDAAWKDVAFRAAHKLGNPIDAIDTFLQSLKQKIQNNRHDETLQIANEMDVSIEESKKVIEQFKSLVKSQEITPCPTDILSLIQHACKTAEENGVNISIQTIDHCPQVMVDPDRIAECFNELIANALHWFDKTDKKIVISVNNPSKKELPEILDKTQRYLKIHFEDNGCGVLLENKEKIFAPFFTTYPHGTGLGLSLVKSIIESHGGRIYENGKPGEGVSFEIYLPIARKTKRG